MQVHPLITAQVRDSIWSNSCSGYQDRLEFCPIVTKQVPVWKSPHLQQFFEIQVWGSMLIMPALLQTRVKPIMPMMILLKLQAVVAMVPQMITSMEMVVGMAVAHLMGLVGVSLGEGLAGDVDDTGHMLGMQM